MNLIEWIVLLLVPASAGGARYLWRLNARYRAAHSDEGRFGLSWMLAIAGSAAFLVGSLFAIIVVLRRTGQPDLANALGGLAVAGIILLEVLPVAIAAFLRLVDARATEHSGGAL